MALVFGISSSALQGADQPASGTPRAGAAVRGAAPRDVGVEEFERLRADSGNVVLDVRTKEEWEAGHLPGAMLLDFNGPNFAAEVAKLDKSKTYLVHCAAGGRSAKAVALMQKAGFTSLVNFKDGYRGWVKAGHQGVK